MASLPRWGLAGAVYNRAMSLLEREPFLAELTNLLSEGGRVVFLSGEAGVGKTTLVRAFCQAVAQKARVAIGACDPLSTPRPLGPLLDVAEILGLEVESARDQLFRNLLSKLSTQPTLLIFEDVHWADEATLDLLRFVGRRIGDTKALLVATYRDDEVGPKHPLRVVLGDLATSSIRRMTLAPLSAKAVRQLAEGSGLDAIKLHQQTGGNPFFITEILAARGEAMPATVRDAVLARVARLSASSRAILEAAAVIGARVESWLLTKVVEAEIGAIEDCLDSGTLLVQGDGFSFRHELARQAVLSAVPPYRQQMLHGLVLDALQRLPNTDLARLAHHAEGAGDAAAVLEYAPKAAHRAAGLKAHREAAAQYARALRFAENLEPSPKAALIEAYAYECYLTEQHEEAVAARQQALDIWSSLGERQKEGENLRWLSRLNWFLVHNLEAERYAQAALEVLEPQPPGLQLAMAYSNLSQLRMLTSDGEAAITWGEKAANLARQLGDTATLSHALNNIGTAGLETATRTEEGWAQLQESLRLALEANLEEHAARAWTNMASISVKHWRIKEAKHHLEESITYATDHDLDSWRLYMQGWQALWLFQQSRWDEAVALANILIQKPRLSPISRIQALVSLGWVRARRGDPQVWEVLDEALLLAEKAQEVQRLGPVRLARAEARWLEGNPTATLEETNALYKVTHDKHQPWLLGEVAYWRWKVGDLHKPGPAIARPFALQIEGHYREAALAWLEQGCPYEAARALSEGNEAALKEALSEFERLGAEPMAQIVNRRLRELGVKGIPRGPRPETKTNPVGLTKRELEVLQLLAQGQRDKQIARSLNLSEKTVGHHVSAILGKLGSKSRAEAVSEALKQRILTEISSKGQL
jgi:predicted ATPase/DNA-binding CsgD family transcriptional regulator